MNKEKQIEELTKILLTDCEGACTDCEYYDRYDGSVCIPMRLANALYNAGYRKQSEGKWSRTDYIPFGHDYICSLCKKEAPSEYNFCPNCGAKMKGGAE